MQKTHVSPQGFSFIEVLLTIGLFAVLVSFGISAYVRYYRTSLISIDHDNVLTHLKKARFLALKNPDNASYGVHFDQPCNCLEIYQETFDPGNPKNISLELKLLTIKELHLTPDDGATADILFERRTGATQNTGHVVIGNKEADFTFTINPQGIVN